MRTCLRIRGALGVDKRMDPQSDSKPLDDNQSRSSPARKKEPENILHFINTMMILFDTITN